MTTSQPDQAQYPVVCFGEMLWDLLPTGAKPGGAPMNVAYHLQKLGLTPAVITRVGTDERGAALLRLLAENGTSTAFVQKDDMQPTGVVLATLNEKKEASYDIVQPVAWDFITWQPELEAVVEAASYFVFGSLATRHQTSRNTVLKLLQKAQTKVFDINLRPPHFSQSGLEELLHQCDILKINDSELQLITSWYGTYNTIEEKLHGLQQRFQLKTIVATCGADGALLCHHGQVYRHPGYKVTVKDTVGSGDAFLAAFLYQLHQQAPYTETLAFANAFGAFVASCEGAWPNYAVADVLQQMNVPQLQQPIL